MRKFILLSVFLFICVSIAPARIVDKIVAYVNDDIITLHELEGRIEERALELEQVYRFTPEEAAQRAKEEREQLLDQMIRERLLIQEAQKQQIEVSEAEVDQYIANFKKNAGIQSDQQLRSELARRDLTLESFREQGRRNIMAQTLVFQEIVPQLSVTETEIDRFFEENRSQFPSKQDDVTLRHIFIAFEPTDADVEETRAQALDVLEQARQPGADFADLVGEYSQNPQTKEQAGLLELLPEQFESLPAEFREAVNDAEPGQIVGPVQAHGGFHIIRLESRDEDLIQLRHIFLLIEPSQEARDSAQERAVSAFERLEQGEDFAIVAREFSEDEETKYQGGALGTRNLSEFPPEIRQVVQNLTVGELSTPVTTRLGVHIFKLEAREPAKLTEQEREEIRMLLRQTKFEEQWRKFTDELKERSFVKIKPL